MSARLRRFDRTLEDVATDLGAGPLQRFRRVTAPLTAPAILGAALVVLALSWDEFQITFFTIGDQNTLPLVIWSRARRVIDPSVNAIGTLMIAGSLVIVLITRRFIADSYS
jgi:spermidine/putrescine transport system permease protein